MEEIGKIEILFQDLNQDPDLDLVLKENPKEDIDQ